MNHEVSGNIEEQRDGVKRLDHGNTVDNVVRNAYMILAFISHSTEYGSGVTMH